VKVRRALPDETKALRLALDAERRGDSKVAAKHWRAATAAVGAPRRTKAADAAGEAYLQVMAGWQRLDALLPNAAARKVLQGLAELAIEGIKLRHRVGFQPRAVREPAGLAAVNAAVRALRANPRKAKTITRRTLNKHVRDYLELHGRDQSVATVDRHLRALNDNLPEHWRR